MPLPALTVSGLACLAAVPGFFLTLALLLEGAFFLLVSTLFE